LQDLADAELEAQIMSRFIEQLKLMSEEEQQTLQDEVHASGEPVIVRSAFEVASPMRQHIQEALGKDFAVEYKLTPELICGIELKTPRYEIAWSVRSYMDALENNLAQVFDEVT
jgi:F-type H+-transporting ATPase subunit b